MAKQKRMLKLSKKEIDILRFIRSSRHKTTVPEIAKTLGYTTSEVETFVQGMVERKLLNVAPGSAEADVAYYTNPEKREEIYELIG
jgi:DNA-binding MarR family transcriptional regulator